MNLDEITTYDPNEQKTDAQQEQHQQYHQLQPNQLHRYSFSSRNSSLPAYNNSSSEKESTSSSSFGSNNPMRSIYGMFNFH